MLGWVTFWRGHDGWTDTAMKLFTGEWLIKLMHQCYYRCLGGVRVYSRENIFCWRWLLGIMMAHLWEWSIPLWNEVSPCGMKYPPVGIKYPLWEWSIPLWELSIPLWEWLAWKWLLGINEGPPVGRISLVGMKYPSVGIKYPPVGATLFMGLVFRNSFGFLILVKIRWFLIHQLPILSRMSYK